MGPIVRIPYMHRGQERVAPPRRTKPSNEGIGSRAEGNHEGAAGLCLWALGGVLWAWGCGLRVIGSAFWALGLRLWAQAKERMWTLCQKIAQERQQANRAKRNIKTQRACACVRSCVCVRACVSESVRLRVGEQNHNKEREPLSNDVERSWGLCSGISDSGSCL